MNILLVDDDEELCALLRRYLERELFKVTAVHTADEGLTEALSGRYQAVVLDIMLPGGNGLEILAGIRKRSELPVIMLTAKGDEMDRIEGLEIGADDYIPKPCNPRELSARLRSILRRGRSNAVASSSVQLDELTIDFDQHQVSRDGEVIDLTVTEFNILSVLARDAGKVVDKNRLAEQSMQRSLTLFDRSLDMHLSNLRKKLGPNRDGEARIKTIRGVGYMYIPEEEVA
ncbi:MAG: response regulator transcription factor [Thalassolituus sp.]|jgi:DNA-binding response OmpR family regulator|uniref:Copper-sensing two-component system response regulator CpxR n=1 Tax=hydrothermal vent metagenome TaxID=652676 RepID=A0A160THC8_9ZZZZ|nr:response regulator transcription factor [Thalassolituus oleivorans]AHK16877.1 chemotaxis protein CheY [Thalassolituus oleivorans R6-15]APR68427.1 DNA-binding response regulator [Thalassolituus oleivorans]MBQ0726142.1 response regulator transcription factor [Thalassolituus oleivorans]MBQ0781781.1 response regulator transcription factor [Thalassolituus oleivorans]MDF1640720.1 response regulator transcription factor [Thalassolituus oleivorans]|tara:strand:- start:2104 stop:2793 length:690 start_codon:yes stop_codon:yes gene_type:complete